ncbi:MAG TPA: PKD domain-containing protein [Polyangia bacterium]|jgi:MYXO-CTERM domain-containing protein
MKRALRPAIAGALAIVGLMLAVPAAAATDVMGQINADTHWSLAGSPYRLTGDVTVAPQATLTIDPGVEVVAQTTDGMASGANTSKVELTIQGALAADGTAVQPIVFRGAAAGADVWYGITLAPGARASSFSYAQISDASYAIYVRSTNPVTLSYLTVTRSQTGLWWQTTAGLQVQHSTFDGFTGNALQIETGGAGSVTALVTDSFVRNATGVGVHLTNGVTATVKRTHLILNGTGLTADAGVALTVVNDVVAGNKLRGLDLTQAGTNAITVSNCTIDANIADIWTPQSAGLGVHVRAVTQASSFIVRNNTVTNHGTAGIKVDGGTAPALDHNNVWQNAANYLGATAGAGSLSTNPLYTQGLAGVFVSSPITQQPLPNNFNNCGSPWVFTQAGAVLIRLRFTDLRLESGYDHVYVLDASGATLNNYTGTIGTPTTSAAAVGTTIKICATSDGSGSSYVTMSGYEYLPTYNYRLQSNSPLIDQGNDLDAPTEDCDGVARPYDGDTNGTATTDIGAYEWHQNVAPYASAGPDQIVLPSTTVSLNSAGSHDPDGTIVSYDWNFGDGSAHAATPTATHSYASTGTYTVTLTVTDDQGASGTDTCVITVATNLPPAANAGPDQFVAVGATVNFDGGASSDADGTIVGYAWSFGDGSAPGSGRTVSHAYAASGVYTVTLTVTDNRGATGTDTAAVVVGGGTTNQRPTAAAGGPYTAAAGQALQVSGAGSHDPDGTIVAYAWDFGDGATGTGGTASHTYAAAGTYLLKLTVTDNGGATADDATLVSVTAATNQAPVANAGGNKSGNVGQTLSFDGRASTDADGTIAAYDWDFGDGSAHATTAVATHTYASAGAFLVRLKVTDNLGATGEDVALVNVSVPGNAAPVARAGGNRTGQVGAAVAFDGSTSTDADGSIAAYDWDFGDGTTHATTVNPTHSYAAAGTYLVRLTVTDNLGATGSDVAVATISAPGNQLPIAAAGGNRTGQVGQSLEFDGSDSTDPDGTIASYEWDFGDGSTKATTAVATHAYAAAGTYLVRLKVADDKGALGQDVALVTISAPGNQPPVANAGGSQSAAAGTAVTFSGSGSHDADGTIVSFEWDFGDGSTHATTVVATHTYAAPGTYLVRLTVTDDKGATGLDVAVVTVTGTTNQPPVATAGGSYSATLGQAITFDGTASSDPDGTIASYAWTFGDGETGTGAGPRHTYAAAGTFLVRLTVTDDQGATATDVAVVTITGPATAGSGGGCSAAGGPAPGGLGALAALAVLLGALGLRRRTRRPSRRR